VEKKQLVAAKNVKNAKNGISMCVTGYRKAMPECYKPKRKRKFDKPCGHCEYRFECQGS
jgi:hypothetical protein